MFYIGDLFQWERFITPSIIKLFYWLVVIIVILAGLSGLVSALGAMAFNPVAGAFTALASFAGMLLGILFARRTGINSARPRERGDPVLWPWIPACAGMSGTWISPRQPASPSTASSTRVM